MTHSRQATLLDEGSRLLLHVLSTYKSTAPRRCRKHCALQTKCVSESYSGDTRSAAQGRLAWTNNMHAAFNRKRLQFFEDAQPLAIQLSLVFVNPLPCSV